MSTFRSLFESTECSRCGGSGKYSYCSMHGTMCFGCSGKGVKLTKRGMAAQEYLTALRCKPVEEIEVGDQLIGEWDRKWATVNEIEVEAGLNGRYIFRAIPQDGSRASWHAIPGTSMRVRQTSEEFADLRALALAYQATLTKSGTPRKKAVK